MSILLLGLGTSVLCAPFEQFQTGGFSNFDPNTGTFSVGTNTNLYQETSSNNADDFLLSFEKVFPSDQGSFSDSAAFNPFASADGNCDEFCQKVFALDAQSQAQFEQDFLAFQSQFGNSLNSGEDTQQTPVSGPPQTQPPRVQTQVAGFSPNNNNNNVNGNSKPDENFKSNNNVQNKNFLFFGNNNNDKAPNRPQSPPIQQQTVTNPPPTRSTTPFTVFTTTRRTTRPPRPTPAPTEVVKNSAVTTARSQETSSKKTTKIKWTYNGKTIGTSTITEAPPGDEDSSGEDKLPVSPFFNEVRTEEDGRQERRMEGGARRDEADFPVFAAVPS